MTGPSETIRCRALTPGIVFNGTQRRRVKAGDVFDLPREQAPAWWAVPLGGVDEVPLDPKAQRWRDDLLRRLDALEARRARVSRTPAELARRFAAGTGPVTQRLARRAPAPLAIRGLSANDETP
jgi:hypothetical protein